MSRHWTVDELTDRLYGIRGADEHLSSCGSCGEELRALDRRRAAVTAPVPVSAGFLASQRSAVIERVEAPPRRLFRWVPALSAACLLVIGVLVYRPVHAPTPHSDATDAQLFADIYNVEESAEPLAAAPIHELFQEGQQ
jgi:hypothetical protein